MSVPAGGTLALAEQGRGGDGLAGNWCGREGKEDEHLQADVYDNVTAWLARFELMTTKTWHDWVHKAIKSLNFVHKW